MKPMPAVVATLLALMWVGPVTSRAHDIEFIPVFPNGPGELPIHRIPALAVTGNGTLIACCEARPGNGDD